MTRAHVYYYPPRKSGSQDRDPCLLFNGRPKRAWTSEEAALAVKADVSARRVDAINLTAYPCEDHGWHLGNAKRVPYQYRVLDREQALLYELGPRVVANLLTENDRRMTSRYAVIKKRTRRLGYA